MNRVVFIRSIEILNTSIRRIVIILFILPLITIGVEVNLIVPAPASFLLSEQDWGD